MEKIIAETTYLIIQYLPQLFLKIIIVILLVIFWPKLVGLLANFIKRLMIKRNIDELLISFIDSLLRTLGYIVLFFIVISTLGVKTTSLVALLGAAGLAVGLALQGSLSNLAGGALILFFRPFSKGDYIATTTKDLEGRVISIRILYTTLLNNNQQEIIIPNSQLANASIINYSAQPLRRLDLTFSASYDDDVDLVISILTRVAKNHPKILQNEPFTIRLKQHNTSSLDYTFRAYTKNDDYWDVFFDCNEMVRKEFLKEGIEIPYNKLDVYTKE